jgi:hypothetical protein
MRNPLKLGFLHVFARYYAVKMVGHVAESFDQLLHSAAEAFDKTQDAKDEYQHTVGNIFGQSADPVEGDSVQSEAIWDFHRALTLRSWIRGAQSPIMHSDMPLLYSTYLDSVSYISARSAFKEAQTSNRVVGSVYAGLLPGTVKLHNREPHLDLMTDYVSGLRVVWDAAGAHQGHREIVLNRLQMALHEIGTGEAARCSIGQVQRFIKEVSPQST